MNDRYTMPVIVRCAICWEDSIYKEYSFIEVSTSFPAQLVGYRQTHEGSIQARENIYLCQKHYENIVNPPKVTIEQIVKKKK